MSANEFRKLAISMMAQRMWHVALNAADEAWKLDPSFSNGSLVIEVMQRAAKAGVIL